MELLEREADFSSLQSHFERTSDEGCCVFISGEAGIGKTSLVRHFCRSIRSETTIYSGTCDALFTPRPLAPLYDIAWQMGNNLPGFMKNIQDRSELFSKFFHTIANNEWPVILLFEDIHWADEATLDFIKFFTRRISQTHCLFLCTFRDSHFYSLHSLKNVLGELSPDFYTQLALTPFSKKIVDNLALERGYNGDKVYRLTGGNPFYVHEILASYSKGIPQKIKDSILSVYNRLDENTKRIWELLSIIPKNLEIKYLKEIFPSYHAAIEKSLESGILIQQNGLIFFKHELYRRTIELSLPESKSISLHKRILEHLLLNFEESKQIERIVHHAKHANENEVVKKFAPIAAQKAASVGAHTQACKLYFTAIKYSHTNDTGVFPDLYECYAYECYLTGKIKEAIESQQKALEMRKGKNEIEKTGNCMTFLSKLWWFDGNRKFAETLAHEAIAVLDELPSCKAKAMAYSNMCRLYMQSDLTRECIYWGKKALKIAKEVNDENTVSDALTSIGSILMCNPSSYKKGKKFLLECLRIALKNGSQEDVAHAFTELGTNAVTMKEYDFANKNLTDGISFCEEKDLDSIKLYMLVWKARLNLETGKLKEAFEIVNDVLKNKNISSPTKIMALCVLATIKIRKGEKGAIALLMEAKSMAFVTMELVRILPVFMAMLEFEWLTGESVIETGLLSEIVDRMANLGKLRKEGSRFYFWLIKAGKEFLLPQRMINREMNGIRDRVIKEAEYWVKIGSPYEYAVALFEGDEMDKRKSIAIMKDLDCVATVEKLKREMIYLGIKGIPRGLRQVTRENPAQLTAREMDVLQLLKEGIRNKEIASRLFISPKTVDHHICSILFKMDVNSRGKAVQKAIQLQL
jgi:DNA-binding CsgD family transcriptional regulator/tetratricopeptide (TPR) repeat protein